MLIIEFDRTYFEMVGLEEKLGEQRITPIVRGMEKNWIDNAKEGLAGLFGGKK